MKMQTNVITTKKNKKRITTALPPPHLWPLAKKDLKMITQGVKISTTNERTTVTDGFTIDTTCVCQLGQFDELTISQKNKFVSLWVGKKISSHGNHMTEDHGNWVPQNDLIVDLTFLTTKKITFHKFLKLP